MNKLKIKNSGFTTAELVVAIGVAAIAALIIVGVQRFLEQSQKNLGDKIEGQTDTEIGRKIILQDLRGIDPSFSHLYLKDDDGRRFFDYYPDVPVKNLGANVARKLTLKMAGTSEVIFLVLDSKAAEVPLVLYDPMAAYLKGPTPNDINQPASINFISLNKDNYITDPSPRGLDRPGFWRQGQVLMLDTPAQIRAGSSGNIDMLKVPRSPIFVGEVRGGALVPSPFINSIVDMSDPQDESGVASISSADEFLRGAPSVGGGLPMIRLKALKVLRYSLVPGKKSRKGVQLARLVKQFYENGRYSKDFGLAENVKEVVFERASVTEKAVYFSIKTEE